MTAIKSSAILFTTVALLSSRIEAQETPVPIPRFSFLRQNEDWSALRNVPVEVRNGVDPWKYVPLNDSGSIWSSFGAQATSRFESWSHFGFNENNNAGFLLSRVRAHADIHLGGSTRFFTEIKTVQATDRNLPGGRRTLDLDTFDLQQAFFEFDFALSDDSSLSIRPGRQMFSFGAQRLISPLPWANSLRAWDGISADLRLPEWNVTALATAFAPVDKTDFNEADTDELLLGIYATRPQTRDRSGLDVYAFGNSRENIVVNGTAGDARRATLGVRAWGKARERCDWEVEADYQFGEIEDNDVSAWSLASLAGWAPCDRTRVWAGLDWASGDDTQGGSVQTFDQLYPLGHAFLGFVDAIGRQNVIDLSLGGTWKPYHGLTLSVGNHAFWTDSQNDAIYNAGGGVLRPGGSFTSSSVGFETDWTAAYRFDQHWSTLIGYSHFFAGDALSESGPSDDADFAYAIVTATF